MEDQTRPMQGSCRLTKTIMSLLELLIGSWCERKLAVNWWKGEYNPVPVQKQGHDLNPGWVACHSHGTQK